MAFVTSVVEHWLEREIAQLVPSPHMKDRSGNEIHNIRLSPLTIWKEGNYLFIYRCTQHILFTVIWCWTYGKGLLTQ